MDEAVFLGLIRDFKEKEAEQAVVKLGNSALPIIYRELKKLEHYDSMRSQLLCSLLNQLRLDQFDELMALSEKIPAVLTGEFTWLFRTPLYQKEPDKIAALLKEMTAKKEGEEFYLTNYYIIAGVVELLARLHYLEAGEFFDQMLSLHLKLYDPMKKDYFSFSGEEYLTAALSTALLLFSENGYKSAYKTPYLIETAALAYTKGKKYLINSPLPLLFIPTVDAGRSILHKIAVTLSPVDPLLSDLSYYLKTAQKFGIEELIINGGLTPLDWLAELERKCDPTSYGPGCAVLFRKTIDAESSSNKSMDLLYSVHFSYDELLLVMQGIDISHCSIYLLLFISEIKFLFSLPEKQKDWSIVNKRLSEYGITPVKEWQWRPELRQIETAVPAKLEKLVKIYQDILSDPAAFEVQPQKTPALLVMTALRLLSSGNIPLTDSIDPVLEKLVYRITDDKLLNAVYEYTKRVSAKSISFLLLFLKHPALHEKSLFIEELIDLAVLKKEDPVKTVLTDTALRIGWGIDKGDYGIWNKLTLYFAEVAEERVIDRLVPLKGRSTLGSALEIAIINLAERYPKKINDTDFEVALYQALEDGFTDYKRIFIGERCRKGLLTLLSSDNREKITAAARGIYFIVSAKKNSITLPIELLTLIVMKLSDALDAARTHPGEEWEDRNWGGYNASPEEFYAHSLCEAVKALSELKYNKSDIDHFKEIALSARISLSGLTLFETTSYSIQFYPFNLEKALLNKAISS